MPLLPNITNTEAVILSLLIQQGHLYGLELVRASDGRLKSSSIYVLLDRAEDKGLIESWKESAPDGQQGPPRRKYKVTGQGEAALAEWRESLAPMFTSPKPRFAL